MVAVLTFVLQQRLPYRKMLITTGILLGIVLLSWLVNKAREQLAYWIPRTEISWLANVIPRGSECGSPSPNSRNINRTAIGRVPRGGIPIRVRASCAARRLPRR